MITETPPDFGDPAPYRADDNYIDERRRTERKRHSVEIMATVIAAGIAQKPQQPKPESPSTIAHRAASIAVALWDERTRSAGARMNTGLGKVGSGLTDKLYWRESRHTGKWHCYEPANARRSGGGRFYVALCHPEIVLVRSGGQSITRPPSPMRCAVCDCREMTRRGWDEGGETSPDWHGYGAT